MNSPFDVIGTPLGDAAKWLERYRKFWEGNHQRLDALLEAMKAKDKRAPQTRR